jgi:taurine--2-oxoglutarate transaminase
MTGDEMVALSKRHTLFEWSAQSKVDPIPVARAKGIYFWTPEGQRFIDFNSQLMCVNIGHGDERVVRAIQDQAATLAYANPFMATEPRARLASSPSSARRHRRVLLHRGGTGPTRTPSSWRDGPRAATRFSRYRSYHGATAGGVTDRRSAALGRRAGYSRCRARARPVSWHRRGWVRPRNRSRCSRKSSARGRTPSRRSFSKR